jgi:toxin ParE1/3/4
VKPAVLRPRAEVDLLEIAQWYAERGGESLAERFFDAAREASTSIERMPGIGSPRLGQLIGLEGLRSWPLNGFPVRWFYLEQTNFVDLVRLLADRQDIAAILRPGLD